MLYPEIEPYSSGLLPVDDQHSLYYEEAGNPDGYPVLFLHGGPGGGISPKSRRFFDPEYYRILLFDQRGSGKSLPHAELKNNTTPHLLDDIETLRSFWKVKQWLVFGGSWGSTLALRYAIAHPKQVTGLILRGIFLARPWEVHWLFQEGASAIFPDAWEDFIAPIPIEERDQLIQAHYKRLCSDNLAIRKASALAWSNWESAISRLTPSPNQEPEDPDFALAISRIEAHYFMHNSFLEGENYLLEHIDAIRHIPSTIVQGRYDIVCPPKSAWELHRAWPEAQFEFTQSGHAASDPETCKKLIEATDTFRLKCAFNFASLP